MPLSPGDNLPPRQPGRNILHGINDLYVYRRSASRSIRVHARIARTIHPRRLALAPCPAKTNHRIDQIDQSHNEETHTYEERGHPNP